MAVPKDQLEKFIQTVLEIKNSKRTVIHDSQDLKKIAFEMGFSENDWNDYQEEFQKYLNTGRSFLEHNNPGDAAEYLKKAEILNPYELEVNALLAEAYKQQYLKTGQNKHREKAIQQAEKCLEIDNNHSASYQLITDIKSKKLRKTPKRILIILGIGLLLLAGAGAVFLMPQRENAAESILPKSENITPEVTVNYSDDAEPPEIQTVFEASPKSENLKFILESSELSNYDNSYSYKLLAHIAPEGIDVEALKIKINAFNSDNKIIFSDYKDVVSENSHIYRPGDMIPLYFLEYAEGQSNPDISMVEIAVQTIKKQKGAAKYESSKPTDTEWAYERPPNYDVIIKERFKSINSYGSEQCYYKLTLEAENTGNTAIQTLQTEIEWYDYADKIISSETCYINASSLPKIRRGQSRLYSGTWAVPQLADKIKGYKIKIVSVN